jgi:hypothetical protein
MITRLAERGTWETWERVGGRVCWSAQAEAEKS